MLHPVYREERILHKLKKCQNGYESGIGDRADDGLCLFPKFTVLLDTLVVDSRFEVRGLTGHLPVVEFTVLERTREIGQSVLYKTVNPVKIKPHVGLMGRGR